MQRPRQIGIGDFGEIYTGITGQEAVAFLLERKSGEVLGAFARDEIGSIDLVYGNDDSESGFGLSHISSKHPEVLPHLKKIIENGIIVRQDRDRALIIRIERSEKDIVIVRLDWDGRSKAWIVTAFAKA